MTTHAFSHAFAYRLTALVMVAPAFAMAGGPALGDEPLIAQLRPAETGLSYTMTLTNSGTRSQGWIGSLANEDGSAHDLPPGETLDVGPRTFVGVSCTTAWTPCGVLFAEMAEQPANVVLGDSDWRYEWQLTAAGSRSEGERGVLFRDGNALGDAEPGTRMETPMGLFVFEDAPNAWGLHGWFPVSVAAPAG